MIDKIDEITDNAIQTGYINADREWKELALEHLRQVCLYHEEFTMDDVRGMIKLSPIKTHDNRAMGGIVKTALKENWIEATGRSIPSKVGHKTPIQIWKSLLYKPYNPLF